MAPTTNLLSWAAFEQLPDDGMHREILEGKLITLLPPKARLTVVATSRNALKATDPDDYLHGAPELAIDVIESWESATDVDRKKAVRLGRRSKRPPLPIQ